MNSDSPTSQIKESIEMLFNWVINHQYLGWDIYDGLNSPFFEHMKNRYFRVMILQFNKYSPINMRPLLNINKGIDVKGMGLFAQSYISLYKSTGEQRYLSEMKKTVNYIKDKSLKPKYGYDCWSSHYFPTTSVDGSTLSADSPDIIGTCHMIITLIESYKITKNSEDREIALCATNFLIDELFEKDKIPSFKYTISPDRGTHITLNASAQAVEALSSVLSIENNSKYQSICEKVSHTLLQTQREDGSWVYSIYRNGLTKRIQLDFHQGYMIDGLLAYLPYSNDQESIRNCIIRASDYYQKVLFCHNGRSYYRYPLPYPTDIHNQAQGIITFSKLSSLNRKYIPIANKIALWTIANMQDKSGYFYYQKWPLIINKIPHMRWGQAWMMLALATALETLGGDLL